MYIRKVVMVGIPFAAVALTSRLDDCFDEEELVAFDSSILRTQSTRFSLA